MWFSVGSIYVHVSLLSLLLQHKTEQRHFSYNILRVIFGIPYSAISLYLHVSVPTSLALKSTFVDLKCIQFFLRCPKARMHGAIVTMTRHGGHFHYSIFRVFLFRIPRFTNSRKHRKLNLAVKSGVIICNCIHDGEGGLVLVALL